MMMPCTSTHLMANSNLRRVFDYKGQHRHPEPVKHDNALHIHPVDGQLQHGQLQDGL